ncbi:carboxypeptidase-like regulatory domain-containing protein [Deminuibacter soli]|uniref:Carboxypeptidase-like regulatory domain-containing protein n=1 Tax=Deminuibacter soli TaxID=2291815 RepID=A0A3E1NHJ5_9BACT|nr:carboxypeptidase-like regulatory domain-containing protein [Deminuibacter soli]RFM27377.1 hypothetical protein DXN05_15270 [Deminuibacter soli]
MSDHLMNVVCRLLLLVLLAPAGRVCAQSVLTKDIVLHAEQRPLGEVLNRLGKQGGFYFSYNSILLNADSLVNCHAVHVPVKNVLDGLLGGRFEYHETPGYLILLPAASVREHWFYISGYVTDKNSGSYVSGASVYETQQLVSALTNDKGYFRLRLRGRYAAATINVSKDMYQDTVLPVAAGYDQQLQLSIVPAPVAELTPVVVTKHVKVEKTWLGRFFLSSKQKMRSLNLNSFFTTKPVQMSITPGLSTHNKMGSQVVNKASLNILGGYTAGLDGAEVAGLFNISQRNVRYVQLAGLFNVVGGHVYGVQAAGFSNTVLDSLNGVQLSGGFNIIKGSMGGVQASGYYNHVSSNTHGVQATGIVNIAGGEAHGVQLAGIANIGRRLVNGVQVAGILNYTHKLKGVQIGLINIADTSRGYSIGLINISKVGYHQLLVYANDVTNVNLAYRAGNKKLYSILLAGINTTAGKKAFGFGYGLGTGFYFTPAFALTLEATAQQLYLGSWNNLAQLYRAHAALQYRIAKNIALFAGPAYNFYHTEKPQTAEGYKYFPLREHDITNGKGLFTWTGWQFGIALF